MLRNTVIPRDFARTITSDTPRNGAPGCCAQFQPPKKQPSATILDTHSVSDRYGATARRVLANDRSDTK
jgi:hypothetical protein